MENQIDVSFVVPMYNAYKYIGDCIESILSQGIEQSRYEIIVIDDGSIDNGVEVVKRYGFVRYYRQDNKGQSSARNKGIELARGKYLCFIDSDDMLISNSIKSCLDIAIGNELDMITYEIARVSPDMKDKINISSNTDLEAIMDGCEYIEKYNFNNGAWWFLVKKDSIGDLRFIDGRYGEDGIFIMELLMRICRIAHIGNQCYYYFIRPQSITTKKDILHVKKMINDYIYVYHHMQHLIKDNRNKLSCKAIERCDARSKTYIFFALVRLLKYSGGDDFVNNIITNLKKEGLYPIAQPYPGVRFAIASMIINNKILFFIIHQIFKHIG